MVKTAACLSEGVRDAPASRCLDKCRVEVLEQNNKCRHGRRYKDLCKSGNDDLRDGRRLWMVGGGGQAGV